MATVPLHLKTRNPSGTLLPFLGSGFPYIIYQQKKGTLIVIWLLGYQEETEFPFLPSAVLVRAFGRALAGCS